ncbi:MAG: protein translocase subunit SecD [Xanthomonadales bacterium]|nr:protein translocase subunit SecD [Xanthomonadales bacterium]
MINFPKWKYGLVLAVILLAALYALPNLHPQDPAVQLQANRGNVVDEALRERIQGVLERNQVPFTRMSIEDERLLVRFPDTDTQLRAIELVRQEVGEQYVSALNLASTVPDWLASLGGKSMTLGLDLQGGVHFTMEVDQRASIEQQENRFVEDIRVLLRDKRVRYQNVSRTASGIVVNLRSEADRERAYAEIAADLPELVLEFGRGSEDGWLINGRISEATLSEIAANAIEQNVSTLRNRVNELGVAEPIIQRQGESRIVVQLPGVQDTAAAKRILGATATLEYRAVDEAVNAFEVQQTGNVPPDGALYTDRRGNPVVLKKRLIVSGDQLVNAASGFDSRDGSPMVSVRLNAAGARRMQEFTNENVGKGMAVVFVERIPDVRLVDGREVRSTRIRQEVISIATIREPFGRNFQTTGLDSASEASELALLLRAGALAAPIDIVEERVIGPSLGQDNIERGTRAIVIGFAAVLLFMLVYYRMFGLVANIALVANVVLIVALLSLLGATLTMPGIAGIVLTIGMAVDANVLIFERIREEIRNGNTPVSSIRAGYDKAWTTIIDANITTLIAGVSLLAFGSGPVRGFAVVLCIGILTSMFTAVTVSEAIVSLIYGRGRKVKGLSI